MTACLLWFPIEDSYDKHQASYVRQVARQLGLNPKEAERDFIASCRHAPRCKKVAERAPRACTATHTNDGPEAA